MLCCICLRVVLPRSQAVSRGAPAPFSGRGDRLAEDTLPHASPRRFHGVAGAHVRAAERRDGQRERGRRQGVGPQQPPVAAQPDVTDGIAARRETYTGMCVGGGCPSGGGGLTTCVGVAVSIPGTALHALGPRSVHRELSVPGRRPPAVRPPAGAGAARAR